MPVLSMILLLLFLGVVFPLRSVIRKLRYGSSERATYDRSRPTAWWIADGLFLLGFVLVVLGPGTGLIGLTDLIFATAWPISAAASAGVLLATGLAVWAQETMGRAWRPDLPPASEAALVTAGPFRLVRNPNYTAMVFAAICGTLIAPTWLGIAGVLTLVVGLELTARSEESLLRRTYGDPYRTYASRTGRFVPGVGLIADETR